MRFSSKTSKTFLPLVLTSAIAAITGCNGGSGSDSSAKETVQVQSTSSFTALYMDRIDHNTEHQGSAVDTERLPQAVTYFSGSLTAVDTATNTPQEFDWPLVLSEDGMVTSQKTVTLEPGTYDFTLVVNRGSQQYTAVLLQYQIDDQGEYRLDFQLDPVAGDTIVDFDNVKLMSRLKLEFPSDELAAIDVPQIGLIVDGVETIYQLNKNTGIADITLNYQGGTHTYDVNLYNGNQLIGRSALGPQSVDLELNTDFTLDLISLQADVTVDINGLSEPSFIFNIPQEIIDHVGDAANVNLMARITDNETVQEVTLSVELVDGKYQARHSFGAIEGSQVTAYLEFLDITDGESNVVSTCADSIHVYQPNKLDCAIEIAKDYMVSGNLLATLSINVLSEEKVAQAGAKVFVNGELVGITGDNFGTAGFVKTYVKAGEQHIARAEKNGLEDTNTLTPNTLSINNFDLILKGPSTEILGEGPNCKAIFDQGNSQGDGLYRLTGSTAAVVTWCDMTNEGWTLVMRGYQGDRIEEWKTNKRLEVNAQAVKSPIMTETFKFDDYTINALHDGRQKYRIMSDYTGNIRYAGGDEYCHDSAEQCALHLERETAEEAYMGTYADEALSEDYAKGVNGSYLSARGGFGSDLSTYDSADHWMYLYSTYRQRGWQLGPYFHGSNCYGNSETNNCHFTVWVK